MSVLIREAHRAEEDLNFYLAHTFREHDYHKLFHTIALCPYN